MKKAPAIFIGHGSPMNVIEENEFNFKIKSIGEQICENRPRAILCLSAHYQTDGINIDGSKYPKTIYDFTGFPEALYKMNYPVSGDEHLAVEVAKLVKGKVTSNWGLDHGAWNVLWHLFPKADIPVVMMSLDYNLSFQGHFELGKMLSVMRDSGVMILGSGNIVHSFKGIQVNPLAIPNPNAENFQKYVKNKIQDKNYHSLITFDDAIIEDAKFSVNSAEHYLPLLYILGASDPKEVGLIFNNKIIFSTLSMMSVVFGL